MTQFAYLKGGWGWSRPGTQLCRCLKDFVPNYYQSLGAVRVGTSRQRSYRGCEDGISDLSPEPVAHGWAQQYVTHAVCIQLNTTMGNLWLSLAMSRLLQRPMPDGDQKYTPPECQLLMLQALLEPINTF